MRRDEREGVREKRDRGGEERVGVDRTSNLVKYSKLSIHTMLQKMMRPSSLHCILYSFNIIVVGIVMKVN